MFKQKSPTTLLNPPSGEKSGRGKNKKVEISLTESGDIGNLIMSGEIKICHPIVTQPKKNTLHSLLQEEHEFPAKPSSGGGTTKGRKTESSSGIVQKAKFVEEKVLQSERIRRDLEINTDICNDYDNERRRKKSLYR